VVQLIGVAGVEQSDLDSKALGDRFMDTVSGNRHVTEALDEATRDQIAH
jgi:hypothetical protein